MNRQCGFIPYTINSNRHALSSKNRKPLGPKRDFYSLVTVETYLQRPQKLNVRVPHLSIKITEWHCASYNVKPRGISKQR